MISNDMKTSFVVEDSNMKTKLEYTKDDVSVIQEMTSIKIEAVEIKSNIGLFVFQGIKIEGGDFQLVEKVNSDGIKIEEDDFPSGKNVISDGSYVCSFNDEKFQLSKEIEAQNLMVLNSNTIIATRNIMGVDDENVKHVCSKRVSSNENNYIKCASDEGEDNQDSGSEKDNALRRSIHEFQKIYLKRHMNSVHRKRKPFKCAECDYTCSQKYSLLVHIKSVHRKFKLFKCSECDSFYSQKGHLTKHVNYVHRKVKTFKCTECVYSSSQRSALRIHIRRAHGPCPTIIKPFQCYDCAYSCSAEIILDMHIKSEHKREEIFKCAECDHSCSQKGDLNKHIKSVHSMVKPFRCAECIYSSSRKENLVRHLSFVHRKK